jgi:hypothetical protein
MRVHNETAGRGHVLTDLEGSQVEAPVSGVECPSAQFDYGSCIRSAFARLVERAQGEITTATLEVDSRHLHMQPGLFRGFSQGPFEDRRGSFQVARRAQFRRARDGLAPWRLRGLRLTSCQQQHRQPER